MAERVGVRHGPALLHRCHNPNGSPGLPRTMSRAEDPGVRGVGGAPHLYRPGPLRHECNECGQLQRVQLDVRSRRRHQHERHRGRPRVPTGRRLLRGLLRRPPHRFLRLRGRMGRGAGAVPLGHERPAPPPGVNGRRFANTARGRGRRRRLDALRQVLVPGLERGADLGRRAAGVFKCRGPLGRSQFRGGTGLFVWLM